MRTAARALANDSRHHARVAADERHGNAARADGRGGDAAVRRRSREHLSLGQAEQDDRRPAGARRRRWRVAAAGRCRHRRPGDSNGRAAARRGTRDAGEIDRAVDRQTGYRTKNDSLRAARFAGRRTRSARSRCSTSATARSRPKTSAASMELAAHAAVALENTQQFAELLERHEKLVEQAAQDTLARRRSPGHSSGPLDDPPRGRHRPGHSDPGRERHRQGSGRPQRSTTAAAAASSRSSRSTARRSPKRCSKASCSATRKARSPTPTKRAAGKFELASGGTLFLDEIGDMSLAGQAKLLARAGREDDRPRRRQRADSHRRAACWPRRIRSWPSWCGRSDFAKICTFGSTSCRSELPPLRERGDDIMLLAEHFLRQFCRRAGRRTPKFSAAARKRLDSHTWPGNVRELRNLMERLAYLSAGDEIEAEDLAFILSPAPSGAVVGRRRAPAQRRDRSVSAEIHPAIDRAGPRQRQPGGQNLGVHRSNLYRKMRQLGMETDEDQRNIEDLDRGCHPYGSTRLCLKREGEAPAEPNNRTGARLSGSFALPKRLPKTRFETKPKQPSNISTQASPILQQQLACNVIKHRRREANRIDPIQHPPCPSTSVP